MTLHFTEQQRRRLLENGSEALRGEDHLPIVKLFTPDAHATWLLTELDPESPEIAFGLCDLGMGFPELGYVSLEELGTIRGKLGLSVERDLHFEATHPISVYAEAARMVQHITTDIQRLQQAEQKLIREGILQKPQM